MTDTTVTPDTTATDAPEQATHAQPEQQTPEATPTPNDAANVATGETIATPEQQPEQPEQTEAKTFDENYVKGLRSEAAKYRTERNDTASKLDQLIDGLRGLTGDKTEAVAPEQVIETLTTERDNAARELATLRTEHAINKAARAAGADTDLLALVLKGKGAMDSLDPTADDFTAQVAELVTTEVEGNPKLKAAPAVATSSGSAPEDAQSPRNGQLTRADMNNMSAKEINEAVQDGRFRDVLGG